MTEKGIVMRKPDTDGVEVINSSEGERGRTPLKDDFGTQEERDRNRYCCLGAFAFYELEVHTWKLGVVGQALCGPS